MEIDKYINNSTLFVGITTENICSVRISKTLLENFINVVSNNPFNVFKTSFPVLYFTNQNNEYKKFLKRLFDNVCVMDITFNNESEVVLSCHAGYTSRTNIIYDKYKMNVDLKKNNFEIPNLTFSQGYFDPNSINFIELSEDIADKVIIKKPEERGTKRERE